MAVDSTSRTDSGRVGGGESKTLGPIGVQLMCCCQSNQKRGRGGLPFGYSQRTKAAKTNWIPITAGEDVVYVFFALTAPLWGFVGNDRPPN